MIPRGRWAYLLLALAGGAAIVSQPDAWQVVLAAAATLAFARDRRLGPLPAAMLVAIALPYDRAANSDLLRLAGMPVRPQDAAIGIGMLLALTNARWPRRSVPLLAIGAFLVAGLGALLVGYLADYPIRDVLRDARWWFLYLAGPLALATGVRRDQVLRALLIGAAAFAVLAVLSTALPAFAGGLKERSLDFDRGTLRMQFGNSIFLLPALALALWRQLRRPSWSGAALVWLLFTAITLSLTRTFVLVALASGLGVVLAYTIGRGWLAAPRASAAAGILLLALASGIGLNLGNALASGGESAVDRFLFEGDRAGVGAIVSGRFVSYRSALEVILQRPVTGLGLGTLVPIGGTYGGDPFATPGWLPNVDNAYLTVGMKAGALGIAAFAAMLLSLPLALIRQRRLRRLAPWLLPAWTGLLVLTLTQSFATTGYSPFGLSLLLVLGSLAYASSNAVRARAQL